VSWLKQPAPSKVEVSEARFSLTLTETTASTSKHVSCSSLRKLECR